MTAERERVLAQGDADSAFETYLETFGGAETNAWHDAPVDGVFKDGFKAGLLAQAVPAQQVGEPKHQWHEIPEDSLARLYVGQATSGDQLLAHNAIFEAQCFADMYIDFKHMLDPYVSLGQESELPASVIESFGVIFDHWLATKDAQQSPAVAVPSVEAFAAIIEKAVQLYSHKWSDEFCDVTIGIMKTGMGYIHPEGLIEFAKQIRSGEVELPRNLDQLPRITEQDALQKLRTEVGEAINILAMCGDKTPFDQLGKKLVAAFNDSSSPKLNEN